MSRSTASTSASRSSRSRYGKEVQELKDALNNNKIEQKRDAIRKIIDAMTRGKDVSMLFPDIAKNIETPNLELKKLVYLYIINYAKILPDLAIMAINSFCNHARDKNNPFLRALAIRTMGCIRVKQITEYLMAPVQEAVKDEDSYVRKTAAICIAKLYDVSPEQIEEKGFLKMLQNLLNDGNAMVVSNAVCALLSISENKGVSMLELNQYTVQKILTAMNECNEWGVIYTLDAIALYTPEDAKEAENIIERVSPRLNHQNPGVVLSACKIIMRYLDFFNTPETIRNNARKMTAPLISLLSGGREPEIEYVALKNIAIILQKRPMVIEKEIKMFFCNFNDPIYIKLQKLEVLSSLASNDNIQQILHELKEYTQEVDVEFVRKAVRAIGRCAIKLEKSAEKCVQALWECLRTKVNYVVQECIIVIRDIFRKYPRKYEMILKDLCDNLKSLDDPEAKASMIWIIGEYVDTIENADELLNSFYENFKEDPAVVQHQILVAATKLFLQRPKDGHELIQNLLRKATNECENPDLRDRAYIYLRILNLDPELGRKIVFAERPPISEQSYMIETELLNKLVENIGNLSSVYLKAPEKFVKKLRDVLNSKVQDRAEDEYYGEELMEGDQKASDDVGQPSTIEQPIPPVQQTQVPKQIDNLLDMDEPVPQQQQPQIQQQQPPQQQPSPQSNLIDQQTPTQTGPSFIKIPFAEVLNSNQPGTGQVNGLQIEAAFQKKNGNIFLDLRITNKSADKIFSDFGIKFNNNAFKLQPNAIEVGVNPIPVGQAILASIGINCNGQSSPEPPSFPFKVQVALKTNLDVYYFFIPCSLSVLFTSNGLVTPQKYQEIQMSPQVAKKPESITLNIDKQKLKQKLADNFVNIVGIRTNDQGIELQSYSVKLYNEMILLLDLIHDQTKGTVSMQLIAPHPTLLPLFYQAIGFILTLQ